MMTMTAAQIVTEAKGQIQNLTPAQVAAELADGATLIDIREPEERMKAGWIPGALPAPRGMLEFYADPVSPSYRQEFDPTGRITLACASGGRSALSALTLRRMGYEQVAHLDGGLNAWKAEGLPVEANPA